MKFSDLFCFVIKYEYMGRFRVKCKGMEKDWLVLNYSFLIYVCTLFCLILDHILTIIKSQWSIALVYPFPWGIVHLFSTVVRKLEAVSGEMLHLHCSVLRPQPHIHQHLCWDLGFVFLYASFFSCPCHAQSLQSCHSSATLDATRLGSSVPVLRNKDTGMGYALLQNFPNHMNQYIEIWQKESKSTYFMSAKAPVRIKLAPELSPEFSSSYNEKE